MKQVNNTIAITGASGFIGRRLVAELRREGGHAIRVLSRDRQRDLREDRFGQGVEVCEGDLGDPGSLKSFLEPGCIVVHLAYLRNADAETNLACTANLLAACRDAGISRLVHCSTAAVVGRNPSDLVDENTPCMPVDEYGMTKLQIERDIVAAARGRFDSVILRPTAVLGADGEQLKRLAADISGGTRWKNYLKSCLFGRRRMNLVPVENVVAAIVFLIDHPVQPNGAIFLVSNDDDPKNNFADVEEFLMDALGVKRYRLPRLPLPLILLKWLLILLGRNLVNPRCDFAPDKLRSAGFQSPVSLGEALSRYVAWYRATQSGEKGRPS
ncbi:MAG: NAD-dependent epimerase/dehydratase family protein [Nitrosomonadales bacterium]|nr:NAD-dependent epimerase/dehydratase family protein [Nitrosomonadales bacterium]